MERLWHNTRHMVEGLKALHFDTGRCETPIVPVLIGDITTCFKMCNRLDEEGTKGHDSIGNERANSAPCP